MIGIPTYDLECINWTIPIAAGFFDGDEYHEFLKENEQDDVIWRFLCYLREHFMGIKLYAHCGSKFDGKFILDSLCRHNETVALEAGFMRLRWKEPNITFEDSYLLLPMSLGKAAKLFDVDEKGYWDHSLSLSPWEMGDSLKTFRQYLRTDCLILSQAMYKLCELLGTTFGQMPSMSLSTTAAKIYDKCFYPLENIDSNEPYEPFIRQAIYGARNEVYKRYGEAINHYDIKSMFVSCYNLPVPIGKMRWSKPNMDEGTLVEATVKVPKDWYIGPLPYKQRSKDLTSRGRLIFPVGEFTGWWDTYELRKAIEMGVDVSIRRQLNCEEEPVLKDYGAFVAKLRGTRQDEFWKFFGLALSGKFGQDRWMDSVKHISEIEDFRGYTPIDNNETYFSTKTYSGKYSPYIKSAVSMRIRAAARVKHLNIIQQALKTGEVFYGDTDSIFTTTTLPQGTQVGDLVFIGKADKGYFIRQKLYAIKTPKGLKQVSAGYSDLKLTEDNFKGLLTGGQVGVESPRLPSYRQVLRSKEVALLDKVRALKGVGLEDNRLPEGNNTRPIVLP